MDNSAYFPDHAAAQQARITPLRGFSGCHVFLIETSERSIVRKIAKDATYNDRLLRQIAKQVEFSETPAFGTAKIFGAGQLPSGLVYFDMEYIPGAAAAETLACVPLHDVRHWSTMLLGLIQNMSSNLSPDLFHAKIAALRHELGRRDNLKTTTLAVMDRLARRSWHNIPHSACHGDATLENMIVHDGRIYLIDFLDNFADSWYFDIAKLMQDLRGMWSFRHDAPNHNLSLRLAALRLNIEQMLETQYPGCLPVILDLYALNLLRIIPYCSSRDEQNFIECRLSDALPDLA